MRMGSLFDVDSLGVELFFQLGQAVNITVTGIFGLSHLQSGQRTDGGLILSKLKKKI